METENLLHGGAVLLVTGGARGITAQCAISLAKAAKCKFILAGRTPAPGDEPAWAAGSEGADALQKATIAHFAALGEKRMPKELQREVGQVLAAREITATLQAIGAAGGQAVYLSADVTDAAGFAAAVAQAASQAGPVTGVIHGAGNLADKLIENKSEQDFNNVVQTKVQGLNAVLNAVDPAKLEFLVLFSSVAGFYGNSGQADYAIANEILNKSAYILCKALPKCRLLAINWGPWDAGMVSPQLKKVFERRGIPLIRTEDGAQTLLHELTGAQRPGAQVVAGSPIFGRSDVAVNNGRPVTVRRNLSLGQNPFAADHTIGGNPVLPATCASAWLADACEAAYPGWRFFGMQDFKVLKGITFDGAAQTCELRLEPQPQNDPDEKLVDLAVTSQNSSGRKVFRYSGRVRMLRELPPAPVHPQIAALASAGGARRDGSVFYADGTLFHGPAFQGIREVLAMDEKQVLTRVELPEMSREVQGQFAVCAANPFFNDAVVQSLLIWTQEFQQAPCLPSRLREWANYRPAPFGKTALALLTVTFHNAYAVSGDITVTDEDGRLYFQYSGLEGTISRQLNRFIGKKAA